jgi:hypothetical protein
MQSINSDTGTPTAPTAPKASNPPEVGSSSTTVVGPPISASDTDTARRCPPDSTFTGESALAWMPSLPM